ncbi:hypothetical protein Kpol_499p2 [Vanderwaltozyma polyspora DSM 70294]|uniref:Uncharacterized protein n=1 Tax=Vanderwaltozyma polyspora (strain ATCC 22028 / DSM 70294 / BCRC 21397 / CBS 2163 / NBRC 10782 / NRRL Y-8283 / UCD 57-17) TaxID=436907 RepID=A7TP05_VANPO|nr:uncharacterized protein Kpol_499p2 [Vanderwaltozyma polyspora DSM 70294]EDO15974.1 hypothetical protein Kpol_499p2 [Vanderwaltozyma polyspora DSM 70294]
MAVIPPEIIYQILTYQFRDFMSNDYPNSPEKYNENLKTFLRSNLTVNKWFYHICKILVYRYCNFTTAKRFNSLLNTLKEHTEIRHVVEVADFQELTSIGLGRTGEMNKMIKNLTNETLLEFLELTQTKLREFLACEHIQDDLDENVIYFLLKPGTPLSVLDFCGCSGSKFTESFIIALDKLYHSDVNLQIDEPIKENYQITCLGLNDCTDLPPYVVTRTLKMLPELQKLDLTHTSIDDETLSAIPHLKNLTHISFAMCLQLTPRAILEFFAHHPAISDVDNTTTLEWLNLRVSPHTSSWTEVHTMFLLKKLCRYGHNKTLQYLNIGGMPLHEDEDLSVIPTKYYYKCKDTLQFIKCNFPKLKSLSIRDNNVSITRLCQFLTPENTIPTIDVNDKFKNLNIDMNELAFQPCTQRLKFLNVSNNTYINKWTIQDPALYTCSPSLVAIEVSFDAWRNIENMNDRHELVAYRYKNPNSIIKDISKATLVKWKCYIDSSYGRRYWLYKVDPYLNKEGIDMHSNMTKYDSQGNKIIEIIKHPDFLKFAQTKIMLGCGLVSLSTVRRKQSYRDFKPPISQFLTRKGDAATNTSASPITTPRLPPGGWRLMHTNESSESLYSQTNRTENNGTSSGGGDDRAMEIGGLEIPSSVVSTSGENTFRALYWDRSIHDLHSMALRSRLEPIDRRVNEAREEELSLQNDYEAELEETDDDYLNNPDLQRRRSQLSLLKSSFSHSNNLSYLNGTSNQNTSYTLNKHKPKNYYQLHPEEYIYDKEDSEITQRYRLHFDQINEYQIFGTIERGMYRYYSLKT